MGVPICDVHESSRSTGEYRGWCHLRRNCCWSLWMKSAKTVDGVLAQGVASSVSHIYAPAVAANCHGIRISAGGHAHRREGMQAAVAINGEFGDRVSSGVGYVDGFPVRTDTDALWEGACVNKKRPLGR